MSQAYTSLSSHIFHLQHLIVLTPYYPLSSPAQLRTTSAMQLQTLRLPPYFQNQKQPLPLLHPRRFPATKTTLFNLVIIHLSPFQSLNQHLSLPNPPTEPHPGPCKLIYFPVQVLLYPNLKQPRSSPSSSIYSSIKGAASNSPSPSLPSSLPP